MTKGEIRFFVSQADFRSWLELNHCKAKEVTVGFYKKASGKGGITYAEALDEALCLGWIDGVRHNLDAVSYSIRFSPRKPKSIWSRINLEHVERLKKAGRMMTAGLKIHAERDPARSGIYSFENRPQKFEQAHEEKFRSNKKAWDFFQRQARSFQRTAIWWVVSAKQEETRLRRLSQLIEAAAEGKRPKVFL